MTEQNNDKKAVVDIEQLRSEINKVQSKKEATFSEKSRWDRSISELLQKAKFHKTTRDEKTNSVKELKIKRQKLADILREKIALIKKVSSFNSKAKMSPTSIKAKIEKLEQIIETEVISFDKEKKLTEQIKSLKRQYSTLTLADQQKEDKTKLNKEIRTLRKEADGLHDQVQNNAKMSQEAHEELLQVFSGLDEARKQQKKFLEQFIQAKEEFQRLRLLLNEKGGISDKRDFVNIQQKKAAQGKKIKQLVQSVEQKIKEGKKLTTEDLLAFQAKR